jgi:hypothetical protein
MREYKNNRKINHNRIRTAPHRIAMFKISKDAYQAQSNSRLATGLCSLSVLIILGESDCLTYPTAGNPKSSVLSGHPLALLHTRAYYTIKPYPYQFYRQMADKSE